MFQLKDFINLYINATEEELEAVLPLFKQKEIKKNGYVLRKGHVAHDYIFVNRGALRVYFNQGDHQVTGWVALENEFFCELSSLKSQRPTDINIQAIEHSVISTISHNDMELLYRRFPNWQKFGRLVWERAFTRVLEGIIQFQTLSAEERYNNTLQQTDLIQRVPLKHLSTFLGVTPSSLSRLRKKKK